MAAAFAIVLAIVAAALAPVTLGARRVEAREFFVRYGHGRAVTCAMYDGARSGVAALCETASAHYEQKATLRPSGTVIACSARGVALANRCDLGNAGVQTPTYRAGKRVAVGRFRCNVLASAVRCVLAATGRGFLFTPTKISAVGGASIRRVSFAPSTY